MISIRKNPNFSEWYQVFAFGKFLDEFKDRARAIELADVTAKNSKCRFINIEGQTQKSEIANVK
jgi:hypothetical protein